MLRGPNQNWKLLAMKTTSTGRRLQNIKSKISQQPSSNFELMPRGPKPKGNHNQSLPGSSSTFKLKPRGPN